ncbi:WD40/YVTN/BNR-like repeat-containing protein [Uliginosibacterium sediminicola]|uniref:YCF48-related protein n=1 Tax=Uliginosibacterium sediminicola TaxID=2024550 RepID=A0ABU9YVY0_9RHOO
MLRPVLLISLCLSLSLLCPSAWAAPAQILNSPLYALWQDKADKHLLLGGGDGTLWHSSDGGRQWTQQADTGDSRIQTFASHDDRLVLAIAEDYLLRSDDAGEHWQQIRLPEGELISSLHYQRRSRSWIAGSNQGILISRDAGQSWQPVLRTPDNIPIYTLGETAQGTLLAGGAAGLLLSSRDGEHWQTLSAINRANLIHLVNTPGQGGTLAIWNNGDFSLLSPGGKLLRSGSLDTPDPIYSALYDTRHQQILLGTAGGAVLRSRDLGRSWLQSQVAERAYLNALYVDAQQGDIYTVGARAIIARSRDAGRSWDILNGPQWTSRLNALHASSDGKTLLAVGSGGLILRSEDRGQHWQMQRPDMSRYISDLVALPEPGALQLIGFDGLVARSANGGLDWQLSNAGLASPVSLQAMNLDPHSGRLLVCGPVGSVLRSTDGGLSWRSQQPIADAGEGFLKQLSSLDQTVLALGNPGRLMRSQDDGRSWQASLIAKDESSLSAALVLSPQVFLVAQSDGSILRSSDAGDHWQSVTKLPGSVSSLQHDARSGHVWALGAANSVFRSSDQGQSWTTIRLPERGHIAYLLRSPAGSLLGFGERGSILRSTDEGEHWQQTGFVSASSLRKPLLDTQSGDIWVPGRDGTLLRSSDDGQHWQAVATHTRAHLNRVALDQASRSLIISGERLIRLPLP